MFNVNEFFDGYDQKLVLRELILLQLERTNELCEVVNSNCEECELSECPCKQKKS